MLTLPDIDLIWDNENIFFIVITQLALLHHMILNQWELLSSLYGTNDIVVKKSILNSIRTVIN